MRRILAMLSAALILGIGGVTALTASPAQASCLEPIEPADSGLIGVYQIASGSMVLDIANWDTGARAQVHLWHNRSTECSHWNQYWQFVYAGKQWSLPQFEIVNPYSGNCLDKSLDVPDADGNAVYMYPCSGNINQLWVVQPTAYADRYEIRNGSDGKCLDVSHRSYTDGAVIWVWHCDDYWNQWWTGPTVAGAYHAHA